MVHTLMDGVVADVDGPGLSKAVVVEGGSKSEAARDYNVSRRWAQTLFARYRPDPRMKALQPPS